MSFQTLANADIHHKTVLLRADLNVPMQNGDVSDTTRLDRLVPTIRFLQKGGAKIVIMSHFGRPKGKNEQDSLKPVAAKLGAILGEPVHFVTDCIGDSVAMHLSTLKPQDVAVLENLRFYSEEEENNGEFAQQLAEHGDIYVNDAFSASHRAHASIEALAHKLPAYAGLLMEQELTALQNGLENPAHPVAAIIGGAKISTKLSVLHNLVKKVDYLILGGGMANTFLAAKGYDVGASLCEHDMKKEALAIIAEAEQANCTIVLPNDVVVAKEFKANAAHDTVSVDAISADQMALDIGPESVKHIQGIIDTCKTVLWNGPVGAFETVPFNQGTLALAEIVAKATHDKKLVSVAGGGDTVAALEQAGIVEQLSYVSTAGGAFLEWLEGKTLPGIAALQNAYHSK